MNRTKRFLNKKRSVVNAMAALLALGIGGAVQAQDNGYAVGEQADYTRPADGQETAKENGPVRLARFSYVRGDVSWRSDANGEWSSASINLPLRQEAQILVTGEGRAEIQFDDGSLLRLGKGALVTLQTLYSDSEGEFTEIKLSEGLASLRLKHDKSLYQIDTPFVSVKAEGPAALRVGADSAVEVAVHEGTATVEGSQGKTEMQSGSYLFLADADAPFNLRPLPDADSWERWNADRDRNLDDPNRVSRRYLPSNIAIVADDLDEYGTWRDDPEYGHVWCPRVVETGWRPYSEGHWTWVNPFGWTWVSSEAWGWAPYHYGTWISRPYGWGWCPGPAAQYWSPAVVSFHSYNGEISWCSLSPREVVYPSALSIGYYNRNWALSFSIGAAGVYYPGADNRCFGRPWHSGYVNRVTNITNVTNVTNIYNTRVHNFVENHNTTNESVHFVPRNAIYANGATAANESAFGGRGGYRPVAMTQASIFRQGRTITAPSSGFAPAAGPALIRPTQAAVTPSRIFNRDVSVPQGAINRPVYRAPLQPNVERALRQSASNTGTRTNRIVSTDRAIAPGTPYVNRRSGDNAAYSRTNSGSGVPDVVARARGTYRPYRSDGTASSDSPSRRNPVQARTTWTPPASARTDTYASSASGTAAESARRARQSLGLGTSRPYSPGGDTGYTPRSSRPYSAGSSASADTQRSYRRDIPAYSSGGYPRTERQSDSSGSGSSYTPPRRPSYEPSAGSGQRGSYSAPAYHSAEPTYRRAERAPAERSTNRESGRAAAKLNTDRAAGKSDSRGRQK